MESLVIGFSLFVVGLMSVEISSTVLNYISTGRFVQIFHGSQGYFVVNSGSFAYYLVYEIASRYPVK